MIKEKDLLDLKEQIVDSKTMVSELTGEVKALTKQLKEEFRCNNVARAEFNIQDWDKKIKEIDKQIEEGVTKLEEKYGS